MLAHQQQQPQQQQPSQSVSQSSMSYNIHMNSIHKNMTNSTPSGGGSGGGGGYPIQNMKEEPNTAPNNYSSIVNGNGQDDMSVSIQKTFFVRSLSLFSIWILQLIKFKLLE